MKVFSKKKYTDYCVKCKSEWAATLDWVKLCNNKRVEDDGNVKVYDSKTKTYENHKVRDEWCIEK